MRKTIIAVLTALFLRTLASAGGMEISGGAALFREPYEQGPFVELLLQHGNGTSSGYDRKSARVLTDLPESCYVEQAIGEDPKTRSLVVGSPFSGSYTLYVSADESGVYLVKADVMVNDSYVSKNISGIVRKGDTQEIEITYSVSGKVQPVIRKKVDMEVLKKETEIALIKGNLDKAIGKDAARDLIETERAIANKANNDAVSNITLFIKKLERRLSKLNINDAKLWLADPDMAGTGNPGEQPVIMDRLFLNISKIREQKKEDWFEAQSAAALIEDAKVMRENILAER